MTKIENESTSGLAYLLWGRVFKRNLVIALAVGSLLSLVNQAHVLLTQPWTLGLGLKVFSNFLIPFIVSSVSAWVSRKTS